REWQRGGRLDRPHHGRARLHPEKARFRDGAHRARRDSRPHDRARVETIPGDVGRAVCDLRLAAHRRHPPGRRCRPRPPQSLLVDGARIRLAEAHPSRRTWREPMTRLRLLLAFLALAAFIVLAAGYPAVAQEPYPSRPISLVVPFPPGGVADLTARPVAVAMEKVLKQPVGVVNKTGAAGAVGIQSVATSKPDGYTLLLALSSISIIPEADKLFGRPPAFTVDQFAPVALISADPTILVVRAESPWKTAKDFIEDAKK